MVTVNGNPEDVAGKSVRAYLTEAGFNVERVVVEINLEIIPKASYDHVILKDEDSVEVLRFVGGG